MARLAATTSCVFLAACASSPSEPAPSVDAEVPADAATGGLDGGAPGCVDAGATPWLTLFAETFDDAVGPPFVPGYPELPLALFPEDETRWTMFQNTHPGQNTLRVGPFAQGRALIAFASGQPDPMASKAAIGRERGLAIAAGTVVRLKADLLIDSRIGGAVHGYNTLFDLEDVNSLFLNGTSPSAGLRVAIDDQGRVLLDRGEISGSDDGLEPPRTRLTNLRSDYVLPFDRVVTLEAVVKLGVREPRSTDAPIDPLFDEASTRAWVALYVSEGGGPRSLILRMRGTTLHDPPMLEEVLRREAPGVRLEVRGPIDYDLVQFGATNNRSTRDREITVDNISIDVQSDASRACDGGP